MLRQLSILFYNLKRGILNIFLTIFDSYFLKTNSSTPPKPSPKGWAKAEIPEILILKIDAIGDFLVWLSAAKLYREIFPTSKFSIKLVCNPNCVSLAKQNLDFDEIVAYDRKKYMLNLKYRLFIFNKLSEKKYEKIIYHAPSREYASGDLLIKKLVAKEKISFKSDFAVDSKFWISKSNTFYTSLYEPISISEHINNRNFLAHLGSINGNDQIHNLIFLSNNDLQLPENYIVLFIGARIGIRKWNIQNFIKLTELILAETNFDIVLCGGNEDIIDAEIFQNFFEFNTRIIDYVGKTTINELCEVIQNAKLLIGNETSGIHFAANLQTKSICILGGGHFDRFVPYPDFVFSEFKPIPVYEKMECFNCDWRCNYQLTSSKPAPCIESISVHQVFLAAVSCLK